MRSPLFLFFSTALLAGAASAAQTEYLGLYMQGGKVGYSSYSAGPAKLNGKKVTKTVSTTKLSLKVIGQDTKVSIDGVTFADAHGHPIRMTFDQVSAGRRQYVVADFGPTSAKIRVDNSGTISVKKLPIPKGAEIVDDPMEGLVFAKAKRGQTKTVYVLDPTTISFVKNTIEYKGKANTDVHGKPVTAEWVQIRDPRANTDVYCKANGDLVKVAAPLGIEMYPESKSLAMSPASGDSKVDLASGSRITPVGMLTSPERLIDLKLDIKAPGLERLPSDDHQTATKTGATWQLEVHPPRTNVPAGTTIAAAAKGHEVWIKADLNVPAHTARFQKLANEILGGETDVTKAAAKIQLYVYHKMRPDASIAVLRDANEVLDTCRGVCRDYAILTATLLRAAGIPTRLATGLVSWDGDFYYHAWVSVFDGKHWIGIDSTTDEPQISAAHIELAVGSVGDAFTGPVLDHPVLKVVSSQ
ncbi:MAG TPA: transglutaminase-like domain-containing protein [Fimbriimonadaceae bacterium]|nr:transglutaminase-like domain-containing protein [Fimbriimonadaceae bacterium]